MTRKNNVTPKYVVPESKYREVCKPLPVNKFAIQPGWKHAIDESQSIWPEYVNEVYNYESYLHKDGKGHHYEDLAEFSRILAFLEEGATKSVLVYRRHAGGFSWVVLDEIAYSQLCDYLDITKDFVLRERNPNKLELLSPKTAAEIESQPPGVLL